MSWTRAILSFFGIQPELWGVGGTAREISGTSFTGTPALSPEPSHYIPRRTLTLVTPQHTAPVAEVDNLRERYSPMMYIHHLTGAMQEREHEWVQNSADLSGESVACRCGAVTFGGTAPKGPCPFIPGRAEWSRVIKAMPEDVAVGWWFEFDELTEAGAWVSVLTPEQLEEVRTSVLEKLEEYRAESNKLQVDHGVDPAVMHAVLSGTRDANGAAFVLNPYPEGADEASRAAVQDMDDDDALVWAEDIEDADIGTGETDGQEDRSEERQQEAGQEQGQEGREG